MKLEVFNLKLNQVILFLIMYCSINHGEKYFYDINYEENNIEDKDINDDENKTEDIDINNEENITKMYGFVVGGVYSDIIEHPHCVFLKADCKKGKSRHWTCGSAVLTQRLLLSAAHCIDGCNAKDEIDTFAGSSNYLQATVLRKVQRHISHERYEMQEASADLSLLFLEDDLPLSKYIQRIIIRPRFPSVAEAKVAGWGAIDESRLRNTRLKEVTQKVWSLNACELVRVVMSGTICASSGTKSDYPFVGDSGSSLVTRDKQAIGVVSYKLTSAPEVTVYTNISLYYYWIQDNALSLYCNENNDVK